MRYAQLRGQAIVNVVEADQSTAGLLGLTLIEGLNPEPGIGWSNASGVWQPPAMGQDQTNALTIEQRLGSALVNLENAATNWPTLAPAQKDAVAQACAVNTARLIRLYLAILGNAGV